MKKILFIIWLTAASHAGNAQNNFPFPTAHAEWIVYRVTPLVGPTDYFYNYRYYLKGDSIFLGKTYSKLFHQPLCYCECNSPTNYLPSSQQSVNIGGVREENGKIYFTKFGAGTGQQYFSPLIDTLLFDFTAQVGDTINYVNQIKLVVTNVDTTSEGRKQIRFKKFPPYFGHPDSWVEGKGDMDHLNMTEYSWYTYNGGCFSDQVPSTCTIPCSVTATDDPPLLPRIQVRPSLISDYIEVIYAGPFEKYDLNLCNWLA